MSIRTPVSVSLSLLLMTLSLGAFAQQSAAAGKSGFAPAIDQSSAPAARDIIFSNLDRGPGDRYDNGLDYTVAGHTASGSTKLSWAVRFTPQRDARVQVLSAPITYTSGIRLVNVGIYAKDEFDGSVGTLLPGGEVSTAAIPDDGECCQLTTVTLPGEGVTLVGGTDYWLVVSADERNAPDFQGNWKVSNRGRYAAFVPPFPWNPHHSAWPAAQIRGTWLQ